MFSQVNQSIFLTVMIRSFSHDCYFIYEKVIEIFALHYFLLSALFDVVLTELILVNCLQKMPISAYFLEFLILENLPDKS